MTNAPPPLVSVCVCTYKRPMLLAKLLDSLASQAIEDNFTYEVVVVDNDKTGSARVVAEAAQKRYPGLALTYAIEHIQGISYARNRTVALGRGEFLAFIDDDEQASPRWLFNLFETMNRHQADAVFGPVLAEYPPGTSKWMIKSRLFERPRYANGTRLTSSDGRTGNALVGAEWATRRKPAPFDSQLAHSGGEDYDFFKWMASEGGRLVWSDTATVSEIVPQQRQSLKFILERRFRASLTYWRGINMQRSHWRSIPEAFAGATGGVLFAVLGLLAIPFGFHLSARCWVKSMNGFGRVAALTSLRPIGYGEIHD